MFENLRYEQDWSVDMDRLSRLQRLQADSFLNNNKNRQPASWRTPTTINIGLLIEQFGASSNSLALSPYIRY